MKIHLAIHVPRALRRFRYRVFSGGLILRYHRVMELESDPHDITVTPQSFTEHLQILRDSFCPIGLQTLVHGLRSGHLPRGAVVLTFDDGYTDSLFQVKPLLEQYDIPATVFVTTGYLDQEREFWWDELERLFLHPGSLPETLRVSIKGEMHHWDLGSAAHYREADYQRHRFWNWRWNLDPTPRHRLFRHLYHVFKPMEEKHRKTILQELIVWSGNQPRVRPTHRVLNSDEVVQLAEGNLIEIGAHSVTHPPLSKISPSLQWEEIRGSKVSLEGILGKPIDSFAYPYGEENYADDTFNLVRKAKFTSACSTAPDVIFPGCDLYQLPRVYVGNWSGEEFERHVKSFA